ncbi:MAG TPA: hypothetical protein VEC99_17135, partial [Clostridia bacterium]|nr:hypothetical protein [Clostridia bacterium]
MSVIKSAPPMKDPLLNPEDKGKNDQDASTAQDKAPTRRSFGRRVLLGCGCLSGLFFLLLAALITLLVIRVNRVPRTYPLVAEPISPPPTNSHLGGGLDGFDSPYLGHTGSWNGKGGRWGGGSKVPDLEIETLMGLRWTFMAVYWRVMEPDGPVDLSQGTPPAWKALDEFVIEAQKRRLNILMQAPVVGGNAERPPDWAGRREPGKSAPVNMDAAAEFAGKLAARYAPGGVLAKQQGWGNSFGVRAWELDNEPESYRTCWKKQAADYAEFATKAAARIRQADSEAVILTPAVAGGPHGIPWFEEALDGQRLAGSPAFREKGAAYSIGKLTDVVSFHCYEGLETAFSSEERTIERDFMEVRAAFERWENQSPEFQYPRKQDYWHTEGNYDFLGVLSAKRRAAWRIQFYTRGFAAGIRKLCVMDASPREQVAVRSYIRVLPNPFPMLPATKEISVLQGQAVAFRHPDGPEPNAGAVWVVWAVAGLENAEVEIPVQREQVEVISVD